MLLNYMGFSVFLGILFLLAFGILQWLQVPAGNLVDWLIGIASFWWLLAIVTIPWNVYFETQEVIAEAAMSQEKKIPVDRAQLAYVKKLSRWSILVAIALHILSAIALYWLAKTGISPVGYISSGATLMLTALRPAIRGYQYLAMRLSAIRQQVKYPREDVLQLRDRVTKLEGSLQQIEKQIDLENPDSWAAKQVEKIQNNRQELARLQALLAQFQATNQVEHEQLSREARSAIAQLTEDSQFLNQVREIIRFFKTA